MADKDEVAFDEAEFEKTLLASDLGGKEKAVAAEPEGIDSLKDQLAKAQEAQASAERERDEHKRLASERGAQADRVQAEASRWRNEAEASRYQEIVGAISAWDQKSEALQASLTEAYQAGEFAKAAKLQSEIATAAAQRLRLDDGKIEMEQRADAAKRTQADTPSDPIERYLKQGQITGRSADWVRRHPEIATDPVKQRKVVAAHYAALAEDIPVGTDAYYEFADRQMGYSKGVDNPISEAAVETERRSATPSAPVSRSNTAGESAVRREGGKIILTAAQREIARNCELSDAEYAQSLLALEREGQLSSRH